MLTRLIDRILSALFRVAAYVTSMCPSLSGEPTGDEASPSTIRFSKEDVVTD